MPMGKLADASVRIVPVKADNRKAPGSELALVPRKTSAHDDDGSDDEDRGA